mmetsp:Transcript_111265/g.314047  ORF Transcript_111265/g.314047 Transcript_111265/m.314047 type:complete len:256 (+) Transcript_111265:774-1541(+)
MASLSRSIRVESRCSYQSLFGRRRALMSMGLGLAGSKDRMPPHLSRHRRRRYLLVGRPLRRKRLHRRTRGRRWILMLRHLYRTRARMLALSRLLGRGSCGRSPPPRWRTSAVHGHPMLRSRQQCWQRRRRTPHRRQRRRLAERLVPSTRDRSLMFVALSCGPCRRFRWEPRQCHCGGKVLPRRCLLRAALLAKSALPILQRKLHWFRQTRYRRRGRYRQSQCTPGVAAWIHQLPEPRKTRASGRSWASATRRSPR